MDREIRVSITPSTIITTIVILLGLYVLWELRGLALLVLTAVILASAIEPGVNFFRRRKIPRILAVSFMYLIVFGSFFGLVYYFLPPLIADAENFVSVIPQYLSTLNLPASVTNSITLGNDLANNTQAESLIQTLLEFRSAFSADTSQGAFRLISTIFGGVFSLLLVVVLSFYFAIQETGVEDFLKLITPSKQEEYVLDLWARAKVKIGQWMQGQLIMSVIISITIYLGLVLLQVQDALLLAVLTAIAELIPIFGSIMAGIAAVLLAFTSGGVLKAVMVAGLFIIVNQFEGHLIHPLVVRKVVGVPPLLVILALIAGGELAGFLGVLLAVPLAAVAREALSDFDKRKRRIAKERASA
jgi:predicted PurR-regulated permease PerM